MYSKNDDISNIFSKVLLVSFSIFGIYSEGIFTLSNVSAGLHTKKGDFHFSIALSF
jgi:hypothetical protein